MPLIEHFIREEWRRKRNKVVRSHFIVVLNIWTLLKYSFNFLSQPQGKKCWQHIFLSVKTFHLLGNLWTVWEPYHQLAAMKRSFHYFKIKMARASWEGAGYGPRSKLKRKVLTEAAHKEGTVTNLPRYWAKERDGNTGVPFQLEGSVPLPLNFSLLGGHWDNSDSSLLGGSSKFGLTFEKHFWPLCLIDYCCWGMGRKWAIGSPTYKMPPNPSKWGAWYMCLSKKAGVLNWTHTDNLSVAHRQRY